MIRTDLHMHTYYCDGRDAPEDMVLSAIEKGLEVMGFSGHSYAEFDLECCMSPEETAAYRREIAKLKEKYADRIRILCGIEQDILSELPEKPFDYSIGSVHFISVAGEYIPVDYSPEVLKSACEKHFGGDFMSMAELYFGTVSKVAEATGCSIIGHFDLITKFNENGALFDTSDPRYVRAWKAAADELLSFGIPFEINTGAISRGWRSQPYPAFDIAEYIYKNGGKLILSSDAHARENIAFQFDIWESAFSERGIALSVPDLVQMQ